MVTHNLLEDEPVVSALCEEKHGKVMRSVRFMPLHLDNIKKFWEKSRQYPTLFGEEISGDYKKFVNMIVREGPHGIEVNGLFWVVDDFVGMFYMTDIEPGLDALVHYSFFDGRQKGRLDLCQAMIRYVFEKYQFHRLSIELPLFVNVRTREFVDKIGFHQEGRKREKAFFNNQYFDVACYGLLRKDVLNGSKN